MKIVSCISSTGGCGRSTLCATLATLLARQNRPVLVIEFDPHNTLALHLGAPKKPYAGFAPSVVGQRLWCEAAFKNQDDVMFLAFGHLNPAAQLRLESGLISNPYWLKTHLGDLDFPDTGFVLIDTPRMPSVWAEHALRAADMMLSPFVPEPLAYVTLSDVDEWAQNLCPSVYYVPSRVRPIQNLHQDILAMARQFLGARLLAHVIHEDAAVPEAFSTGMLLPDYAPESQTAHDYQGLVAWLTQKEEQGTI